MSDKQPDWATNGDGQYARAVGSLMMDSGLVLARLNLDDSQKKKVLDVLGKNAGLLWSYDLENVGQCGECPIKAIFTGKYPSGSPEEFCARAEMARLLQTPMKKEILSLMTPKQKSEYLKMLKLMNRYSKTMRKAMKRKRKKSLRELHKSALKDLSTI